MDITKTIKKLLKKAGYKFKCLSVVKLQLAQKGLVLCLFDSGPNFECGIVKKEHEELWYNLQYIKAGWV